MREKLHSQRETLISLSKSIDSWPNRETLQGRSHHLEKIHDWCIKEYVRYVINSSVYQSLTVSWWEMNIWPSLQNHTFHNSIFSLFEPEAVCIFRWLCSLFVKAVFTLVTLMEEHNYVWFYFFSMSSINFFSITQENW